MARSIINQEPTFELTLMRVYGQSSKTREAHFLLPGCYGKHGFTLLAL